jgi:hypothetical protein
MHKFVCDLCKKPFTRRIVSTKSKHSFCSIECSTKFFKLNPIRKQNFFQEKDQLDQITLVKRFINNEQRKKNRAFWQCKCSCGKEIIRREDYLVRLNNLNKSISCGHSYQQSVGENHPLWTGTGKISGFYLATIKGRAKKKNIDFDLTTDYLWDILQKQDGRCIFTKLKLTFANSYRDKEDQTASLDRINPNKGYIENNVQWVHKTINLMKNVIPHDEFIHWCDLVSSHK